MVASSTVRLPSASTNATGQDRTDLRRSTCRVRQHPWRVAPTPSDHHDVRSRSHLQRRACARSPSQWARPDVPIATCRRIQRLSSATACTACRTLQHAKDQGVARLAMLHRRPRLVTELFVIGAILNRQRVVVLTFAFRLQHALSHSLTPGRTRLGMTVERAIYAAPCTS